ncbi:MAG: hypothetical protein AAF202_02270 [Pseudomonadota bacterium]
MIDILKAVLFVFIGFSAVAMAQQITMGGRSFDSYEDYVQHVMDCKVQHSNSSDFDTCVFGSPQNHPSQTIVANEHIRAAIETSTAEGVATRTIRLYHEDRLIDTVVQTGEETTEPFNVNAHLESIGFDLQAARNEPFQPSELAVQRLNEGSDEEFDWSLLEREQQVELNRELENGRCDGLAFHTIFTLTGDFEAADSECYRMAQNILDLDAFVVAYSLVRDVEVAGSVGYRVQRGNCDLDSFVAVFELTGDSDHASSICYGVSKGNDNLRVYLDVYRQVRNHEEAESISYCYSQRNCNVALYLEIRRSVAEITHDQARSAAWGHYGDYWGGEAGLIQDGAAAEEQR